MGKTLLGGTQREADIDLLTPQQRSYLSGALGTAAPQAGEAYSNLLAPKGMEDYQDLFQQSYIAPALQALNKQILPQIQQQFVGANAGSSSALNQALAEAATDVTTNLGGQFGQFYGQQQQLQQQGQLGALGQLGSLAGQRTFEPVISQTQGALGPLLQAIASIYGGGLAGVMGANPLSWFGGK